MAEHWIKFNTSVWNDKVICADTAHFCVWWYLKSHAAYQTHCALFSGEVLELQPGQLVTGAAAIGRALGIDHTRVMRILRHFTAAGLITQRVNNRGRIITVLDGKP